VARCGRINSWRDFFSAKQNILEIRHSIALHAPNILTGAGRRVLTALAAAAAGGGAGCAWHTRTAALSNGRTAASVASASPAEDEPHSRLGNILCFDVRGGRTERRYLGDGWAVAGAAPALAIRCIMFLPSCAAQGCPMSLAQAVLLALHMPENDDKLRSTAVRYNSVFCLRMSFCFISERLKYVVVGITEVSGGGMHITATGPVWNDAHFCRTSDLQSWLFRTAWRAID